MTITREGNFTKSPVNVLEEINIFEGHQNRITFQQVYSKTFKCVYQLELYPFDTQVKNINPYPNNSTSILPDLVRKQFCSQGIILWSMGTILGSMGIILGVPNMFF